MQAVVVPEEIFRTETYVTNRVSLPLSISGRTNLTEFLGHGGDRRNRSGSPDPGLVPDAKPLLGFLASQLLTLKDLKAGNYPILTRYFGKMYSRQVIDARNYDPHHHYNSRGELEYAAFPLAFRHACFCWLFYPDDDGNITGLMLVSDIERQKPTN
jgi:hypothetical protein